MKKYHFAFDKTEKNKRIKKILLKKYKNFSPSLSKVIIVLGGDGFMLQTLKKYQKYNKPFYGINCGSVGFLMNNESNQNLNEIISSSQKIKLNALQMNSKDIDGNTSNIIQKNIMKILFFQY